jgi:hypothetical protein
MVTTTGRSFSTSRCGASRASTERLLHSPVWGVQVKGRDVGCGELDARAAGPSAREEAESVHATPPSLFAQYGR